jgi:hypothetical protein
MAMHFVLSVTAYRKIAPMGQNGILRYAGNNLAGYFV